MGIVVVLAALAIAVVYLIGVYNGLVRLREGVKQAFANIDVVLVQRHDELPKLVEACKRYMQYEKDTLERVMQARASVFKAHENGDVAALGAAEGALRTGLGQLYAVAENYPDLKADAGFQHLRTRISQLEEAIADRRELYNSAVNLNNVRIAQFPDVVIARQFGFQAAALLEFSAEQKSDVDLKKLFD